MQYWDLPSCKALLPPSPHGNSCKALLPPSPHDNSCKALTLMKLCALMATAMVLAPIMSFTAMVLPPIMSFTAMVLPPIMEAQLHQCEQHFQYIMVFVRN